MFTFSGSSAQPPVLRDGVYVPGATSDAPPVFVAAAVPTREQLLALVTTVARRGRLLTDGHVVNDDAELAEPVQKLFDDADPPPVREDPKLQAAFNGFDLHAGTTIEADRRDALEKFIRYCMRGPIANCRLTKGPGNKLIYTFKSRRRDGATAILLTPLALLERLSWLIPNPGQHLTRYHDVLSSKAKWRPLIVPASPQPASIIKGRRRIDWASLLRRVFA